MLIKRVFLTVSLTFVTGILLVSCAPASPSPEMIQTAIAQTQVAFTETPAPIPTNTPEPTSIPFFDVNLEPIVLIDGDLPAGFGKGKITNNIRSGFMSKNPDIISAVNNIQIEISHKNDGVGSANVFVFDNLETTDNAFNFLIDSLGDDKHEISGSEGAAVGSASIFGNSALVFKKCNSVSYIVTTDKNLKLNDLIDYAVRLSPRLGYFFCENPK